MAVLLMEKDPFVESLESGNDSIADREEGVRRPFEGVLPKKARHAFLSLYRIEGEGLNHVSILDSSAPPAGPGGRDGYSSANHNFVLQSVQHSIQDKAQVMETFGSFHVFFYGQKPQFLQCAGLLINTPDFNWKNEWIRNYNRYLSGTRCVETRSRVYLGFDDILVHGFLLNTSMSLDANNPSIVPFNFTFLITGYQDLSEGNDNYVKSSEEARFVTALDNLMPEYLGAAISDHVYTEVDPVTGELIADSQSSNENPDSELGGNTAGWVGDGRSMKLWREPSDALTEIDVQLAMQQTPGSDSITARRNLRSNAGNFPLSSRNDNSTTLKRALSTGISNAAVIIADSPAVS
jgi:hypothetical protein